MKLSYNLNLMFYFETITIMNLLVVKFIQNICLKKNQNNKLTVYIGVKTVYNNPIIKVGAYI